MSSDDQLAREVESLVRGVEAGKASPKVILLLLTNGDFDRIESVLCLTLAGTHCDLFRRFCLATLNAHLEHRGNTRVVATGARHNSVAWQCYLALCADFPADAEEYHRKVYADGVYAARYLSSTVVSFLPDMLETEHYKPQYASEVVFLQCIALSLRKFDVVLQLAEPYGDLLLSDDLTAEAKRVHHIKQNALSAARLMADHAAVEFWGSKVAETEHLLPLGE